MELSKSELVYKKTGGGGRGFLKLDIKLTSATALDLIFIP